MQNIMVKKRLVAFLVIFLIGMIITPNISGNIGNIYKIVPGKIQNALLLNNDYVNVYWKFDDCSGTTLSDSAHNYDGIINGATWTTNGYSGCALEFDGVDDYVDLGLHSAEVLFNKTDDLIFTFYFNSTGTGKIFSATAPWGNNPAFSIELLPNGTLFFNPWTQECGIRHFSSNSYNDGIWHNATYYFNGITTNPTVTLYVDGEFDNSVTHWLCGISNDEYSKTKIGRHAHTSTDYFEGFIDEFKIIKYEQGNEQEIPIIDGPMEGNPNTKYNFSFTTFDPEEDNIWLYIDWDDGYPDEWIGPYSSGEEVILKHKWPVDGLYNITAKSKDIWDDSSWSDPYPMRIGNQPPNQTIIIDGPRFGDVDEDLTYTIVAEDYEGNVVYYYIEWDDGTFDDWFGPYPSGEEVAATHSWDSDGDYKIRARAKDTFDSIGDWSEYYHIRIGDEYPSVPDINGPRLGTAGIKYDYGFVSTDLEGDNISYEITWGDGTGENTSFYPSGEEVIASHTWTEEGVYTIRARAQDEFGAFSEWKEISVTMPRNKVISNSLFLRFLEQFSMLYKLLTFIIK
ncbi:hypothetical protein AYK20_03925 [Thermoplasmatales archaeon SG8-52-1]|nr:MAG: hypothetical protein AYK20_03925 [Thermoplasmatales archaeon SG8-52-1]